MSTQEQFDEMKRELTAVVSAAKELIDELDSFQAAEMAAYMKPQREILRAALRKVAQSS